MAPPLIEDTYNVADAVVVGSLLITLLRRSDRVAAACQAQLVNAIAPIRTEPGGGAWKQTSFYPFAQAAHLARGQILRVEPRAPLYKNVKFGDTPVLDAVATYDQETAEAVVFAVNRSIDHEVALSIPLRAFPNHRVTEHLVLADPDLAAVNTREEPARVMPRPASDMQYGEGTVDVMLPAVSWNVIRLRPAGK